MKSLFKDGKCIRKITRTSYHGVRIEATFDELVEILGEPHSQDDDKMDNTWFYENDNGDVCTIYNWYTNGNPSQKNDWSYFWNIGGSDFISCAKLKEEIENKLERKIN